MAWGKHKLSRVEYVGRLFLQQVSIRLEARQYYERTALQERNICGWCEVATTLCGEPEPRNDVDGKTSEQ